MTRSVEDWARRFLETHPNASFTELTRAGTAELNVSRATLARHLSSMIDRGVLVKLPDGRYAVPEEGEDGPPRHVRFHRVELLVSIFPDGSCYKETSTEMSVVRGVVPFLKHIVSPVSRPPSVSEIAWFTNRPSHLEIPQLNSNKPGEYMCRIVFDKPMTSLDPPLRAFIGRRTPQKFWMYRGAPSPMEASFSASYAPEIEQFVQFAIPSRGSPKSTSELAPGCSILLRVIFPRGFPVGSIRVGVEDCTNPEWKDERAARRLESPPSSDRPLSGLRTWSDSAVLRVPHPELDRFYSIRWDLPSKKDYRDWLRRSTSDQ